MKNYEIEKLQGKIIAYKIIIKTQEHAIRDLSTENKALKDMLQEEMVKNSKLETILSSVCEGLDDCLKEEL